VKIRREGANPKICPDQGGGAQGGLLGIARSVPNVSPGRITSRKASPYPARLAAPDSGVCLIVSVCAKPFRTACVAKSVLITWGAPLFGADGCGNLILSICMACLRDVWL